MRANFNPASTVTLSAGVQTPTGAAPPPAGAVEPYESSMSTSNSMVKGSSIFTDAYMTTKAQHAHSAVRLLPGDYTALGPDFNDFLFPSKEVVLFYRAHGFNVSFKRGLKSLNAFATIWAESSDGDFFSAIAGNVGDLARSPETLTDVKWSVKPKGGSTYNPVAFSAVPFSLLVNKSNLGPLLDITIMGRGVAAATIEVTKYYDQAGITVSLYRTANGSIGFMGTVTTETGQYSTYLGYLLACGLSLAQCQEVEWQQKNF